MKLQKAQVKKKSKLSKATKVNKKKKEVKPKRIPKPKITGRIIHSSIASTLQANTEGEFNLPSVLIRYGAPHPKAKLGLHREFYVPFISPPPYHYADTAQGMEIFNNQASMVIEAVLGEGVPIREKKFNLPLCENCK